MIRSRVSLHVICQSLCLVKDMSNELHRDRIIHFPDGQFLSFIMHIIFILYYGLILSEADSLTHVSVGAVYNHVLQMQRRVLILQLA